MVDPSSLRRKSVKWNPAEHNAWQENKAATHRRKRQKAKDTLAMQIKARALR